MDISVVVCTRNRAESLSQCLRAIFDISFEGSWEIIVVDNGSTDATPAIIERMREQSPVNFTPLVELHPGNSAGRNAAIPFAEGDVVFFTDDDCIVERNILTEVRHVFADPQVAYAGGRIKLFSPLDYPVSIMDLPDAIPVPPGSIVYPGIVQGSNMAFRRKALLESGGFDPVFGAGAEFAGEEMELATRLSMLGWHGGYFPGPVVLHNHGRNRSSAMKSQKQYDIGIGACYGKFLLDAQTRSRCAKIWCRRSVKQLFRHPGGLPRQIAGAIRYARKHGRDPMQSLDPKSY